jgi:hypothetical protein
MYCAMSVRTTHGALRTECTIQGERIKIHLSTVVR